MRWTRRALPPRYTRHPFDRPRCAPRITKEHSGAACAATAQSPPAALNGYDSTTLFHHAAYAASYTARLSNVAGDATSYDRPDLTRQRQDMMDEGLREQARESKREISFACDAIMYEQYVILYCIVGPTCRGSNGCVRAPLRYKREALAVHRTDPYRLKLSHLLTLVGRQYNTQWT